MIQPIEFEIDGEKHSVIGQNLNGKIWIHLQGNNLLIETEAQKAGKRKSSKNSSSGEIISSMPGKITKIFKKLESEVKIGEPVIVMEAMKMEYTLKSEIEGIVSQINFQVGDQVQLGKLLMKIIKKVEP